MKHQLEQPYSTKKRHILWKCTEVFGFLKFCLTVVLKYTVVIKHDLYTLPSKFAMITQRYKHLFYSKVIACQWLDHLRNFTFISSFCLAHSIRFYSSCKQYSGKGVTAVQILPEKNFQCLFHSVKYVCQPCPSLWKAEQKVWGWTAVLSTEEKPFSNYPSVQL